MLKLEMPKSSSTVQNTQMMLKLCRKQHSILSICIPFGQTGHCAASNCTAITSSVFRKRKRCIWNNTRHLHQPQVTLLINWTAFFSIANILSEKQTSLFECFLLYLPVFIYFTSALNKLGEIHWSMGNKTACVFNSPGSPCLPSTSTTWQKFKSSRKLKL